MMEDQILSKNRVPVRLTNERWVNIVEEHCELAGMRHEILETVFDPTCILEGKAGELFAVRQCPDSRYLVVVYREFETDGFIITSFITSKSNSLKRRHQLWPK